MNAVAGQDVTALRYAVMHGNLPSVRILLDRGADINTGSRTGETALAEAVQRGDFALVRLLLDHGAQVNGYADANGWTPLMRAVAQVPPVPANITPDTPWWEMLIKAKPLITQNQFVELLLAHGASVRKSDRNGETVLTLAAHAVEPVLCRRSSTPAHRSMTATDRASRRS